MQENQQSSEEAASAHVYPPKPRIAEKKQNAMTRSLISLAVYALLFYVIFDQDLAYIAAILLVLIIHEGGHFLMMRRFGYSNVRIFIVPLLGAFTSGKKQEVSQKQLAWIVLAGPLPGIIIGTALYYFNQQWNNDNVKVLSYTFLIINLLNMLPFHPLDGGRLIETLFFRDNYIIHLVFGIISIMGLLLVFLLAQNFFLLIVPALIVLELYNESKHQKIREYLAQERIDYRQDYDALSDKDYWLIRDCLIFSFPKKYAGLAPGRYEYSMLEGMLIQQMNAVLQTRLIADLRGIRRWLMLVLYLAALLLPVAYLISRATI